MCDRFTTADPVCCIRHGTSARALWEYTRAGSATSRRLRIARHLLQQWVATPFSGMEFAPFRAHEKFSATETAMPGQFNRHRGQQQERDDRGRFSNEEERGYRGSRSDYGDYDRDAGPTGYYRDDGRGFTGERDQYGRFMSDERRGGRDRWEGDYGNRGGGRESGPGRGWHGDSQGHAEAGRQRWEDEGRGRGGFSRGRERERDDEGRFMSDDDRMMRGGRERDDDGRFMRDNDDDRMRGGSRERGPERDDRGRFMSDDDDDRMRGGFRGRGPERDDNGRFMSDDDDDRMRGGFRGGGRERDDHGRFMSDDDDDRMRGGSRGSGRERDDEGRFASSEDDDDRGGGGRGSGSDHRGWFGDPRGHSRAARLGWRHRDR
jgi:hypothetical protein